MKKTEKIQKYSTFALIIFSILFTKFLFTFCINEIVIKSYESGNYSENLMSLLFPLNFEESYIAHYNSGNLKYNNKDYNGATLKYEDALKAKPPKEKICDVRINLSLSKIALIKNTDTDIYNKLESAKKVLFEDNCAHKNDDNGDSKTAEKLKKEIEKLQESLNNRPDPNDPNNNPENEDPEEEVEPENIEERLVELEKQGHQNREQELQEYRQFGTYEPIDGPNW